MSHRLLLVVLCVVSLLWRGMATLRVPIDGFVLTLCSCCPPVPPVPRGGAGAAGLLSAIRGGDADGNARDVGGMGVADFRIADTG
jgi:hypothetical protein